MTHQIQASGARIEYFNELQIQCGIANPLKIPLHSNIRWGTAHAMLDRAHKLRQASYFIPLLRSPLKQLGHHLVCWIGGSAFWSDHCDSEERRAYR
jgi:hypothetical protein